MRYNSLTSKSLPYVLRIGSSFLPFYGYTILNTCMIQVLLVSFRFLWRQQTYCLFLLIPILEEHLSHCVLLLRSILGLFLHCPSYLQFLFLLAFRLHFLSTSIMRHVSVFLLFLLACRTWGSSLHSLRGNLYYIL